MSTQCMNNLPAARTVVYPNALGRNLQIQASHATPVTCATRSLAVMVPARVIG